MAKRINKRGIHEKVFFVLLIIVLVLGALNVAKARGWLIPEQPELEIVDGTVELDSMTLEQKIAQMVVVQGDPSSRSVWQNMQVGGIHLFARENENVFRNTILDFQSGMRIPFFVTLDLEGCINPFANYKKFTPASQTKELGAAFEKGFEEGNYLHQLGFSLNFAPVVDLEDQIWRCRTFPGDEKKVSELAQAYILGLQDQGVIATIKHYPGKTLAAKDPHKFIVVANIEGRDVYPYNYLFSRGDAQAVMVSHLITSGAVDSEGLPSVVSQKVIDEVKGRFDGLVISDEIHMLGLQNFYHTLDEMYLAVFKAGNDLILNFDRNPNEIYRMIQVVKKAVEEGIIPEEQIDASVTKILKAKGFKVE